ncbi:MAG: glycosyltransferase family 4 protein [Clostridium sp.]
MKIIQLMSYYKPEQVSSSHLNNDLEQTFIKNGFKIDVFTPTPTRGISKEIRKEYKKIHYEKKYGGQLIVHRFSMFPEGKNSLFRACRYFLCNIAQYYQATKIKNCNLVFSSSTPPIQGLVGCLIKKNLKVPFIYNLQDIFPDSLVHTGMTKEGSLLWKIGRMVENYTYQNTDKIIVISEAFKTNLMKKGVPENKIEVIYNWIDEEAVIPIKRKDNKLFDIFNLDREKFYVTYAGNLGNSQNIQVILDAAKQLRNKKDIQFVIFGDGTQKQNVINIIKCELLDNVQIFPMQQQDVVSEVYSLGDASIVSCKTGVGHGALPSKTLSIMSAQTPVLTSFDLDSELTTIINKAKCGICSDSNDVDSLVGAILKLYDNKNLAIEMGASGREYVKENFSKNVCVEKYINVIKK